MTHRAAATEGFAQGIQIKGNTPFDLFSRTEIFKIKAAVFDNEELRNSSLI